jgi:adenylate kinase family enzyme
MTTTQRDYSHAFAPIIRTTINLARHNLVGLVLKSDQHLFSMMYACMSPAFKLSRALEQKLSTKTKMRAQDSESTRKLFKELQRDVGVDITSQYTMMYLTGSVIYDIIQYDDPDLYDQLITEWEDGIREIEGSKWTSTNAINIQRLSGILGFRPAETRLLEFVLLKHELTFNMFYSMLQRMCHKTLRNTSASNLLHIMFDDLTPDTITAALNSNSSLIRSGLLAYAKRDGRLGEIEPFIYETVVKNYKDDKDFFNVFVTELKKKDTAGSISRLTEKDEENIKRIIENGAYNVNAELGKDEKDHRRNLGFNILCYGPKSIDKKNLIIEMCEKNGVKPWVAKTVGRAAAAAPSICYIAQRWLAAHHPEDVLIVENAQDVLKRNASSIFAFFGMDEGDEDNTGDGYDRNETRDELDEHMLLDNPVVSLWMTHNPNRLTQDNLGRFIYHCEVKAASRKSRREGIEKEISRLGLDPQTAHDLSKYAELSEQQVKSAVKLAGLLAPEEHEEQKDIITSAIASSQKAFGRSATEELRSTVTRYSTDLLNLNGQFSVNQIIKSFKKRPSGSVCFYGIPGTGKTALAEHMAVELDLPIIKKRGSDLLSKWVGENEANIAAMFQEAADEGAILLLDEADSFLRDRALARSGWEVTMVNELLQQMERFQGIFICATNLFTQLDAASLRRFTFKLEFLGLKAEQKWKMFLNETELKTEDYSEDQLAELEERVVEIENLTPGDFATVKRQMILLDGTLTPDQWVEQLVTEARTKLAGLKRNAIGFTNE